MKRKKKSQLFLYHLKVSYTFLFFFFFFSHVISRDSVTWPKLQELPFTKTFISQAAKSSIMSQYIAKLVKYLYCKKNYFIFGTQ